MPLIDSPNSEKKIPELSAEVKLKYSLEDGHHAGKVVIPAVGTFDLANITLAQAEMLTKHIPWLTRKQSPSGTPKTT